MFYGAVFFDVVSNRIPLSRRLRLFDVNLSSFYAGVCKFRDKWGTYIQLYFELSHCHNAGYLVNVETGVVCHCLPLG